MDLENSTGVKIKVPDLARGTVLPSGIQELQMKEAQEAKKEKRETRRFLIQQVINIVFGLIAAFAALNSIFQWIVIKP